MEREKSRIRAEPPRIEADFTRTCEGCKEVIAEPWPKQKTGYRCGADGPWRGCVVGVRRFRPYIPAWCPKMAKSQAGSAEE